MSVNFESINDTYPLASDAHFVAGKLGVSVDSTVGDFINS